MDVEGYFEGYSVTDRELDLMTKRLREEIGRDLLNDVDMKEYVRTRPGMRMIREIRQELLEEEIETRREARAG